MAAFNFHRRRTRRWWYAGATLAAAAFFAVFFVVGATADLAGGCDFSPANNGTAVCAGPLSGSTFAGGDGNLLTSPTTFGTTDWQNVGVNCTASPTVGCGIDLPSGTTDNSFGQGTKTDNTAVTVVSGSIPPNKSDLTRFYEASEVGSNNDNFLYLAFERSNVLGTVNMNFEINQKAQPDLTTTGPKTLNRTAGDLLVTYDFSNGGGRPTIAILRWLTSATVPTVLNTTTNTNFSPNVCLASNTFPCWGDQQVLNGTDSIAAVNNLDTVSDPIPPNASRDQAALTFGETAIDLTASGVIPAGTCQAFGSTFVTSRSSASFTSEVKDFIAPIPVNISNCGAFQINKTNGKGDPVVGASFHVVNSAGDTVYDSPTGGETSSTVCLTKLPAGTYTVTETSAPTGYLRDTGSHDVTVGSSDTCSNKQLSITDTPLTKITVTATPVATGATHSSIVCKNGNTVLSAQPSESGQQDAAFTITGISAASPTQLTLSTALTSVSAGDKLHVIISGSSTSAINGAWVATVVDSTHVTIPVAVATAGNDGSLSVFDDPTETFGDGTTGLAPGTYTCTVVVDP
jgi:hypothetical protein